MKQMKCVDAKEDRGRPWPCQSRSSTWMCDGANDAIKKLMQMKQGAREQLTPKGVDASDVNELKQMTSMC